MEMWDLVISPGLSYFTITKTAEVVTTRKREGRSLFAREYVLSFVLMIPGYFYVQ